MPVNQYLHGRQPLRKAKNHLRHRHAPLIHRHHFNTWAIHVDLDRPNGVGLWHRVRSDYSWFDAPEWQQIIVDLIKVVNDLGIANSGKVIPYVEVWGWLAVIAICVFFDGDIKGVADESAFGPSSCLVVGAIHHEFYRMESCQCQLSKDIGVEQENEIALFVW